MELHPLRSDGLLAFCLPPGGGDEFPEQWMGPVGPALQLRVELNPHKPWVVPQLHDFHPALSEGVPL